MNNSWEKISVLKVAVSKIQPSVTATLALPESLFEIWILGSHLRLNEWEALQLESRNLAKPPLQGILISLRPTVPVLLEVENRCLLCLKFSLKIRRQMRFSFLHIIIAKFIAFLSCVIKKTKPVKCTCVHSVKPHYVVFLPITVQWERKNCLGHVLHLTRF